MTVNQPLVVFSVSGTPAPQGSKNPGRSAATGKMFVYEQNSAAQKSWRQDVRAAAIEARQARSLATVESPVWIEIEFRMPRPASVSIRKRPFPAVKPDLDKLVRNTLDALKEAGLYRDDALVVRLVASKMYATDDPWGYAGATVSLGLVPAPEII